MRTPSPARAILRRSRPTLLGTLLVAAASTVMAQEGDDGDSELDPVVVSATRSETPVSELARSVTVVTEEEIQEQAALDRNLGTILAKTVPGLGPSTEAVSNFSQSLRGRNFLVLIDGIPQSTPLRDGFRDLNTIAPSSIERIEVVRGGTAVYGFGAAGGLVNIITKKASEEPVAGYSQVGASFSTEHAEDSGIYETEHRVSGTQDDWDYVLSGSYVARNGRFDSKGRRIPPNPLGSQGGFSDTDEWSLLGKTGHEFDDGRQRIELMLNHYDLEQDSRFTYGAFLDANNDGNPDPGSTLDEDPLPNSRRTPAIRKSEALPGSTDIITPGTENTTGSMNYLNRDWSGSEVRVNAYFGDLSAAFPRFASFPQGEIVSEKLGTRLTVDTPVQLNGSAATVTWGLDYLGDETDPKRFASDGSETNTAPEMDQDAVASFGELELPLGTIGLLRGGVRHEVISVDVSRVDSNRLGNTVTADTLDYDETLFNASSVFYLSDRAEVFGSFSQGFSIADLGRVIEDGGPFAGGATFSAGEFVSEAEKVDNYELGLRWLGRRTQATFIAFYSESDNGTTFDQNLRIQKIAEEIHGIEAAIDHSIGDRTRVGGTFSWAEGESIPEGEDARDLPNTRIQPEKLTAYVEHSPSRGWDNRLQVLRVGNRDPDAPSSVFGIGEVESYTVVDLVSRFDVGPGDLEVAVSNLFNENYFPAANQAFDSASAFAKGPGRRVGASYSLTW